MLPTLTFSDDQAEAYDRVAATLLSMGIDLAEGELTPRAEGKASVLAVVIYSEKAWFSWRYQPTIATDSVT